MSFNPKEKTLHQLVSNLRTIAGPFIVSNNVAEMFYTSPKIIVSDFISMVYEIWGGGEREGGRE